MIKNMLIVVAVLLLTACKVDLYTGLTEQEANQMLALLKSNNIRAEKKRDKDNTLSLRVEDSEFVLAVDTLTIRGFPRKNFTSANELFPSGQLISSPAQEATRINYLKEQSLERMLNNIEGVIDANVVIGRDSADQAFDKAAKSSVSVLVKYSPEINLKAVSVQIRSLITNAIPDLPEHNVALFLQALNTAENVNPSVYIPESDNNEQSVTIPLIRWLPKITISLGVLILLSLFVYIIIYYRGKNIHVRDDQQ